MADVSADADPNTGAGTLYAGNWFQVGGASESSPIIASVYALAGSVAKINFASHPHSHADALYDVVQGNNKTRAPYRGAPQPCNPSYLCNAGPGYDDPAGLGPPMAQAPSDKQAAGNQGRVRVAPALGVRMCPIVDGRRHSLVLSSMPLHKRGQSRHSTRRASS